MKQKASAENSKLREVAFITKLNNEQRKHDKERKQAEANLRRKELLEDRKRKIEEHAAKEEAVIERKRELELEKKKSAKKKVQEEANPRRVRYFCNCCHVEIASLRFLETHLSGKKHSSVLGNLSETPSDCITTLPMDPGEILFQLILSDVQLSPR